MMPASSPRPIFKEPLHVGCPNIGNELNFIKKVEDILKRKWLTNNGIYVQEFEKEVAHLLGVKHCISICNGTTALEIAIKSLELEGEVIIPSFTFIATAHALQWQAITPVFCDIHSETLTLDPSKIEQHITSRTTGILAVHLYGNPCFVDQIGEIAKRHKLKLIYDSSHAFFCSYGGRRIGNFGDAEVFSFHATKVVNTLEGGAITTNNDELANRIRLIRNFGFAGYDNVTYLGINGKMNEISAAMGLASLESLNDFIGTNKRNYYQYKYSLKDIEGVNLLSFDEHEECNFQYIVVLVDEKKANVTRDEIVQDLWKENVMARRYFYPGCHLMEPYCTLYPDAKLLLPVTEEIKERVFVLPTGTAISPEQITIICDIIKKSLLKPN